MAVIHTISATQLERISIEIPRSGGAHVWLRRKIVQSEREFDGATVAVWEADEVYLWMADPPSLDDVDRNFDALWAAAVFDDDSDSDLRTRVDELTVAIAELADFVAGGE